VTARALQATALDRALRFLEDSADGAGLWSDFRTLAGASSDWVSAFIACALAAAAPDCAAVRRALRPLAERQRASGGWAYNDVVPSDCDSASWAVLALAHGLADGARGAAREYIARHQAADSGGFATYADEDGIEEFIALPAPGWRIAHPCVSALALQALVAAGEDPHGDVVSRGVDYLMQARAPSGLWHAYWWSGVAYATYQSLAALRACRRAVDTSATAAALAGRQQADGSWSDPLDAARPAVFETAFALLALHACADPHAAPSMARGLAWLESVQARDGSWNSAPMLRIPPPQLRECASFDRWRLEGSGTGVIVSDRARRFTTASAVLALAGCRP
jgi:squalene-hopene/tetraprenyl-beta-curcumene cyclase